MEKLDSVFLDDIRNHMYFCTGLAVRFVSLVSDMGNVDNPECREILKELMCTLIMEGEAQRVLDFLSVPVFPAVPETVPPASLSVGLFPFFVLSSKIHRFIRQPSF